MFRIGLACAAAALWARAGFAAEGDVARLHAAAVAAAAQRAAEKPAASSDAKGIAYTPDTHKVMVNKPLGGERWAITWDDLPEPDQVTGNVIGDSGVTFIFCLVNPASGSNGGTDVILDCMSGDGYVNPTDWAPLGTVTVPLTFFTQ